MSDPDVLDGWTRLVVAHDRVMKSLGAELKADFGLTIPQYDVLLRLLLAEDHRLKMSDLARSLLYSSGAATKVIDRLVDRGLVDRTQDEADRRGVWVVISHAGLDLVTRARRAHHVSIEREVGAFASKDERDHVVAYLARVGAGHPALG